MYSAQRLALQQILKCNKLVPGVVTSIPKEKGKTYKACGTEGLCVRCFIRLDLFFGVADHYPRY